ncbi:MULTISPECIES: DUF927 domain-containing protein [Paraburkholderia]|uniref:DUF927 domain-containing protein n=1 Tax=Paraburkholderia TaxID=1822464 RepID=UPI0022553540|nr:MULTISPECIES: DUF927 domain-containing protein [Paraburkholderia]MCX4156644.1 DUF927 domain-containing protein [Paraburkholderia aspalathi]MDN7166049.1 DUF927 domain-containing protein [Paraburkholderia sp. SECH2]MDQ6394535.1 DUF927 domain-containing protein [Paraburkholderia aspalathi]
MSDIAISRVDTPSGEQQIEVVTLKDIQDLTAAIPSVPFKQIAAVALEHFHEVIDILGLEGEGRGREFVAYNPRRDDHELGSFSINTATGAFADFACDDECKGGDLIALAAYVWGCGMKAAAKRLLDELGKRQIEMPSNAANVPVLSASVVNQSADNELMSPIPEGSPELDARQFVPRGSILEDRYDYVDAKGRLCFAQFRLRQANGKKSFCTLQVKRRGDGSLHWTGGMPHGLRPLFGLRDLVEDDQVMPVFVVEGEKAALALRGLGPMVVVTSAGGAKAAAKTDWSPLAGRPVVIWPDNDEAGLKYQDQVIELIRGSGSSTPIKVVAAERVLRNVCEARGWAYDEKADELKGWDVADIAQLGFAGDVVADWVKNSLIDVPVPLGNDCKMRRLVTVESGDSVTWASGKSYTVSDEGVTAWKMQKDELMPVKVSSCVEILRQLRDQESSGWSLELRLHKPDGETQKIVVRRATLTNFVAFRETFSDLGVIVYNWAEFNDYLAHAQTRETHDLVRNVGWNGKNYVRADRVFGKRAEAVALDPEAPASVAFSQAGTLESWNERIGKYCATNSRLMLAACVALAAPLLHLLGMESGGVHLVGQSSVGKTTAMKVAASIWGKSTGFIRSWRSTSNGLEAIAASLNDSVLLLDEMGQASPHEAGETIYMLGNGQGKTRMSRAATSRKPYTWRILFMSTGEVPLQQHVESAGRTVRAGMDVRLLNIPADAGCGFGLFESLGGVDTSRALANHLNDAADEVFGAVGDAWLEYLTGLDAHDVCDILKQRLRNVEDMFGADGDGQVLRAARRFAVLALAGELAVEAGIVCWSAGTSTAMLKRCFDAWILQRGGTEAAEEFQALRQVQGFFEQHGQSAFQRIRLLRDEIDDEQVVHNRAGYVDTAKGVFYVLPGPFKQQICRDLDPQLVARVLRKHGLLLHDASKTTRVGREGAKRVWAISSRIVGYDPHQPAEAVEIPLE